MSFYQKGLLNLDINSSSTGVTYVQIMIISISTLIQSAIFIKAIIKMNRNQKVSKPLKACFLASSFCAFCNTVSLVLSNEFRGDTSLRKALKDPNMNIPYKLAYFTFNMTLGCFFLSLLCTVILKLYLTFNSSIYRMSSTMIRLFTVIVVMFFAISLTYSILVFVFGFTWPAAPYCWALLSFSLLLYIVGGIFAVYFFASKIVTLAKIQETTVKDLNTTQNDIKLNRHQQQLSDLAAKSVMLFGIQIISTCVIAVTLGLLFPAAFKPCFLSIDFTINLFCAYLQFGFAENHYQICCGKCDERVRGVVSNRTKRKIYKHSLGMIHNQIKAHHITVPSQSTAISVDKQDNLQSKSIQIDIQRDTESNHQSTTPLPITPCTEGETHTTFQLPNQNSIDSFAL